MNKTPRLFLPLAILCALALALVLAAGASATVYVGGATSPEDPTIANGEGDLLAGSAEYDSVTGTVTLTATTRSAPTENPGQTLYGALFTSTTPCTAPESIEEGEAVVPLLELVSPYAESTGESYWTARESVTEEGTGQAVRSVAGAKTSVIVTTPDIVAQPYDCGLVQIFEGPERVDRIVFPIAVKTETPPAEGPTKTITVTKTETVQSPGPKLTPALAFPRAGTLSLKRERWTTVRFKVTDPGTGPIGPITVKVKAPKGVRVEPGTLRLPALLPGQTWPVSFRIEATAAAAARSKLALTARAGGLQASGSVLLKTTG